MNWIGKEDVFVIYLCGPMENVSMAEGTTWRNRVKDAFEGDPRVRIVDPYDLEGTNKDGSYNEAKIVEGDKQAILISDLLIVNCEGEGCGTWMELLFSWEQNVASFGFGLGEKPNPWKTYHLTKVYSSLDDIIKDVKMNLIVH